MHSLQLGKRLGLQKKPCAEDTGLLGLTLAQYLKSPATLLHFAHVLDIRNETSTVPATRHLLHNSSCSSGHPDLLYNMSDPHEAAFNGSVEQVVAFFRRVRLTSTCSTGWAEHLSRLPQWETV